MARYVGNGRPSVVFLRWMDAYEREVRAADASARRSAAVLARQLILERTERGFDKDGRRFVKYRPRTVAKRRRAGKVTSRVNLRFSGDMWAALSVRRVPNTKGGTREEVYVDNSRARRILRYHVFGTRNMAARDPFGLTRRGRDLVASLHRSQVRVQVPGRGRIRDRRRSLKIMLIQTR